MIQNFKIKLMESESGCALTKCSMMLKPIIRVLKFCFVTIICYCFLSHSLLIRLIIPPVSHSPSNSLSFTMNFINGHWVIETNKLGNSGGMFRFQRHVSQNTRNTKHFCLFICFFKYFFIYSHKIFSHIFEWRFLGNFSSSFSISKFQFRAWDSYKIFQFPL